MYSKITKIVLIIVIVMLLSIFVSCTTSEPPTPIPTTPTPPTLPPGTALRWAIAFQGGDGQEGSYTVTKFIGTYQEGVDPGWNPDADLTISLSCTEHGDVNYGVGYVEFGQGGYIECVDIDLNSHVSEDLGQYIGYDDCEFGPSEDGELCMQTVPFLLWANVQVPDRIDGNYPIFSYPQTVSGDSERLYLSTTVSHTVDSQSIDFGINYLQQGDVAAITEQVWTFPYYWDERQTPQVQRLEPDYDSMEYRFRDGEIFLTTPLNMEALFEFRTKSVTFYFGDKEGHMPEGTVIRIHGLLLDPNDSCLTCL